jgi:hypothetical protein
LCGYGLGQESSPIKTKSSSNGSQQVQWIPVFHQWKVGLIPNWDNT